jgi:serine/threonine protein kinase
MVVGSCAPRSCTDSIHDVAGRSLSVALRAHPPLAASSCFALTTPRAHNVTLLAPARRRRFFKKSEISKNYVLGDTLGSGNFATVKRAQYKGKEKIESMPENVAVKIIDKSKVEDMNDIQVTIGAPLCSGSDVARARARAAPTR